MPAFRTSLFCSALLGVAVLAVLPASAPAAPANGSTGSSCTASWTDQPVAKIGFNVDYLASIVGTSPTSLYAVGQHDEIGGYSGRIVHNSGSGWTDVVLPDLATGITALRSAVSPVPDSAWVGGYGDAGSALAPVLLHVVGSTATAVALPAPPSGFPIFDPDASLSVASSGGTDLWAGGGYYNESTGALTSVVYHRTGSSGWTTTVMPAGVNSIAAVSPTVAYVSGGGLYKVSNGSVSAVAQPGNQVVVNMVVATGADDVWTLGATDTAAQVIDHFNGTTWTTAPLPNPAIAGRAEHPRGRTQRHGMGDGCASISGDGTFRTDHCSL